MLPSSPTAFIPTGSAEISPPPARNERCRISTPAASRPRSSFDFCSFVGWKTGLGKKVSLPHSGWVFTSTHMRKEARQGPHTWIPTVSARTRGRDHGPDVREPSHDRGWLGSLGVGHGHADDPGGRSVGPEHFSSYHRVFSTARWSIDALGLAVFEMAKPLLGDIVMLGLDHTLARKRGLKIFGAGMHHDPLSSTRSLAFLRWGHSWVVLGLIVELPFRSGHHTFLPLLFRLYLNRKSAAKHRRSYRTKPQLAVEMLTILCGAEKTRRFHVVADSAYGGQSVLCHLPENCDLTSRLLLTTRIYDATPPRCEGTSGRPRKRGLRLPSPGAMLEGRCRRIAVSTFIIRPWAPARTTRGGKRRWPFTGQAGPLARRRSRRGVDRRAGRC